MKALIINPIGILLFIIIITYSGSCANIENKDKNPLDSVIPICPCPENPWYWQYNGKPVMLLGGSWQDNLFNHPIGLESHLEKLLSVGGNYVRNTMSHRNEGNLFAYKRSDDGRFNLETFNDDYWQRLENFLDLCFESDIIVQIEIWDPWDHYEDHQSFGGWTHHPFNPVNNINYSADESKMPVDVKYPPRGEPSEHPFFRTVPALSNNVKVLKYQKAYVDKLLSYTLSYPNILYCINNESGELTQWSDYWADYIHEASKKEGKAVYLTDMRRNEDVRAKDHHWVFDYPDRYNYIDISQNNAWSGLGQGHYDNLLYVRTSIAANPRPVNNIKNYGAARHGEDESVARFCRIVFAGCASARFHRPHPIEDPSQHEASSDFGLGLSPLAQNVITSMRWVMDEIEFARTEPRNDLLLNKEENEAYLLAESGKQYTVYFPKGGNVNLDLSSAAGIWDVKWRNVTEGTISKVESVKGGSLVPLKSPGNGHWLAVFTINEKLDCCKPD